MAQVVHIGNRSPFEIYEVEKNAWSTPSILTFDDRFQINRDDVAQIDIVLLGDGFTISDQGLFENHVSDWYDEFAGIWPYSQFLSAFRVHAVYVESNQRVSPSQSSFYNIQLSNVTYDSAGNLIGGRIAKATENDGAFQKALYDTLEALNTEVGLNFRQYPEQLKRGWSGDSPREVGARTGLGHSGLSGLCRNLVVAMAACRDPGSTGVGGYAKVVESPHDHALSNLRVPIAFGRGFLHEFSHAFADVVDEYIGRRGEFGSQFQQNPSHLSVFDLWNVTYSSIGTEAPWRHLAWDGLCKRDCNSLVGQMWIGGQGAEKGVWHSEYKCLVNGGHRNYHYSTDEYRDYADLRTKDRYCLWCEEIVTIRILEKTNALFRTSDTGEPALINEIGRIWYWRWVDQLRANYWRDFDLDTRIADREAWYHNPTNLQVPGVWDTGDLTGTNLMREITIRPRRGVLSTLFV